MRDYAGDTALHDAARFGHEGILSALIAAGGDVSIRNADGLDVAAVAIAYEKHNIVRLLSKL